MNLCYESSDGEIIDLLSDGIYAQNPESLTSYTWEYTTVSGISGLAKIKKFYKNIQEAALNLSIMADNKEQFNQMMYRIHKIFEKDVRRLSPGKLWWNGFYKEVFVVESTNEEFEEIFESIEKKLKVLSLNQYWTKEKSFKFFSFVEPIGSLDYDGLDFPFDYDPSERIETIKNDCIESAEFQIIFMGPVVNPSININGHIYGLNLTLNESEYAIIDSRKKTITRHTVSGEKENVFASRNKRSYIFEKIPEGNSKLVRAKELTFEIVIFDERGEPEWI